MSYAHGQHEVPMTVGTAVLDLTTTGDKARWSPQFQPVKVVGVGIALNAAPGDAGVVKFDKRVTFASDTGRGDGDVAVINLATSHPAGEVIYKKGISVEVKPGQEVVVEVTDASAAVTGAKISLFVEPLPEEPANNTAMTATT